MKQGKSEVVVILDRSGSMLSIKDDTIGGFNEFLEKQKSLGKACSFTLCQFDDQYQIDYDNVDINDVKPLDGSTFVPRGWTALYDAIGRTIASIGERLSKTPEDERPENVIVSIFTDGAENKSTEYSNDRIKELITHQTEKYNWVFMFLGANQDACLTAKGMGIQSNYAMSYAATGRGMTKSFDAVNNTVMYCRSHNNGALYSSNIAMASMTNETDELDDQNATI